MIAIRNHCRTAAVGVEAAHRIAEVQGPGMPMDRQELWRRDP